MGFRNGIVLAHDPDKNWLSNWDVFIFMLLRNPINIVYELLCIFVHSNLFRHGKITHITLRLSLIFQLYAEQQYNHYICRSLNA